MSESEKIKLIALGRIEADGEIYNPGDPFECEETEARRLIGLEAARLPIPQQLAELAPEQPDDDLLSKIAAAATYEEVLALMPEEEPPAEIAAAFEEKLAELKDK